MKLTKYLPAYFIAIVMAFSISCSTVAPDVMEMIEEIDPLDSTTSNLDPAPDFTLTSVSGSQVSLSDFAGKPLVIFFFGNTCPLCISSAPKIEEDIIKQFANTDVVTIGIDVWDGNQSSVQNFRSRTGVTFDLLLQGSGVGSDYSTTYDRLFVINGDSEIEFKGNSSAGSNIDEVVTILDRLTE